jgi:hypothetical protein
VLPELLSINRWECYKIGKGIMLSILRADSWLRRVAGIGCAYALALQMLLAGVVATQMVVAGPLDAAICAPVHSPDGPDGSGRGHAHHLHCTVCALVTFAAPPLDATDAQQVRTVTVAATLQPRPAALAPINPRHTPRSSQGPPQTA